eukprot:s599_g15.t1
MGPLRLGDEVLQVPLPRARTAAGSAWLHAEVPKSSTRALHRNFLEVAKYTETGPSLLSSFEDADAAVQEKPATEPYPENCRVELRPDEPRACEQPWVNWCQDECRVHYGNKKKALYQEKDREQCLHQSLRHGTRC